MSSLIEALYLSGRNVYVVIHAGGQVWNKDSSAFENYNQANWVHYAVALVEQTSSGYYFASYPAGIPAGTLSTECLYQQNSGTPVLPALPAGDSFLSSFQSQGTNAQTIAYSSTAAINLALSASEIIVGAAISGTLSTTQMSTNLTNTHAQAYVGRVIIWTSGVLQGQATNITGYIVTNGVLTFTAVTNAPSAADTFIIV